MWVEFTMENEIEIENNKIGAAIQYFRESSQLSQSKLCKGLCSVATLARIEAGERDVDSLLLETLLERLGRMSNQFELILTDDDYVLYQNRETIKKNIKEKDYVNAQKLLMEYEQAAASKGNVHIQFIVASKAFLNELNGGSVEATIELFINAILQTVPDFTSNKINDYNLSNSELDIVINLMQRMISVGLTERAEEITIQVLEYLDTHNSIEDNNKLYPKVAVFACQLYIKKHDRERALEICNKGLDRIKGNRKMDYLGELYEIKARLLEEKHKKQGDLEQSKKKILNYYLQAYYVYEFCEEGSLADRIKKYLQEEYEWVDIV
jgi:transcriptional regulator with XRE-family HTH domain